MALIKCPECGKKISDACDSCPHCGYPMHKSSNDVEDIDIDNSDWPEPSDDDSVYRSFKRKQFL